MMTVDEKWTRILIRRKTYNQLARLRTLSNTPVTVIVDRLVSQEVERKAAQERQETRHDNQ